MVRAGGTRTASSCSSERAPCSSGRALRAPRRADLALWAVASSLAIATHYFAVFLVAAEAAWLVASVPTGRRDAAVALVLPAAVLVAHLPLLAAQRGGGEAVGATSALPGRRHAQGARRRLQLPREVAGSVLAAALVAVGLTLLATRARPDERRGALVAGTLALAVVGVAIGLALAGTDYLTARNVVLAVVPGAICLAAGYVATRLGLAAGGRSGYCC